MRRWAQAAAAAIFFFGAIPAAPAAPPASPADDATGVPTGVSTGNAAAVEAGPLVSPLSLSMQSTTTPPESIYAPPEASLAESQVNNGGVNFTLSAIYWSDYVYRGIDRSETSAEEDSGNSQVEGTMTFDFGRFPDLFLGVFTNINEADPISRFQEIRPYFGIELTARPIIFSIGNNFYIYPDRDQFNTSELFAALMLDDSYFFRTEDPVLSPYILAAWDYDKSDGFYFEMGIRHDFEFEDIPLALSPVARVAYVLNNKTYRTGGLTGDDPGFEPGTSGPDSGFQHYEFGLELTYALNDLLNIPARYGKFDLRGFLFYTDGIDNDLRASTEIYGGMGIRFNY